MSKQNSDQDELNQYLEGKSALSSLYRQVQSDEPSQLTDQRILNAARQAVKTQGGTLSPKSRRWMIPSAIAATLALTVSFVVFQQQQDTTHFDSSPELSKFSEVSDAGLDAPASAAIEAELTAITKLIGDGQTEKAANSLTSLLKAHPDLKIDEARYPQITALQKQIKK